jgi:hypothetical protein
MLGSQCNQAIMLVTDGAPRDYREVFEKYNWPHKPVRLFSYLIGKEITDTTSTKWMSCHNKGQSFVFIKQPLVDTTKLLSRQASCWIHSSTTCSNR